MKPSSRNQKCNGVVSFNSDKWPPLSVPLNFFLPHLWVMVMYANEFETKKSKINQNEKNWLRHYYTLCETCA